MNKRYFMLTIALVSTFAVAEPLSVKPINLFPGKYVPKPTISTALQPLPASKQNVPGLIKTEPVENGASFSITLPENRSTGYMWYVTKTKNLMEVGDTYQRPIENRPGQGGQRVFVFKTQLSELSPTNNAELTLVSQRGVASILPQNIKLGTEGNKNIKKYLIPIKSSR